MIELSLRFGKDGQVKTTKLYISTGWYSGDEFILFNLVVLGIYEGMVEIFKIQIAKLSFSLSIAWF